MVEKKTHPYSEFETSPDWEVVKKAISDLEENRDLELMTASHYVVGYICKKLSENELPRD